MKGLRGIRPPLPTAVLPGTGISIAGAAPSYTVNLQPPVTILNGGTGATAAGTALDNIGPFASNGYIRRTGAGIYTADTPGQIAGTTTNDNAAAGDIGEFIGAGVASGSAAALTSGTAKDITSIPLSAGDWDVEGWLGLLPGTNPSVSTIQGWVNSTSVTPPSVATQGGQISFNFTVTLTGASVYSIGRARFSLSTTMTIFLSTSCVFTGAGATLSGYGRIHARRVR